MPVIFNLNRAPGSGPKRPRPYGVIQPKRLLSFFFYSAEEVIEAEEAWNFLQLNYHVSWYIKTPMPATLSWTLDKATDSSPKVSPANRLIY